MSRKLYFFLSRFQCFFIFCRVLEVQVAEYIGNSSPRLFLGGTRIVTKNNLQIQSTPGERVHDVHLRREPTRHDS